MGRKLDYKDLVNYRDFEVELYQVQLTAYREIRDEEAIEDLLGAPSEEELLEYFKEG